MTSQTFHDFLREMREAKGLSQNALAKKSGLSVAYINKLERGAYLNPGLESLDRIAFCLSTDNFALRDILYIAAGYCPDGLRDIMMEAFYAGRKLAPRVGNDSKEHCVSNPCSGGSGEGRDSGGASVSDPC